MIKYNVACTVSLDSGEDPILDKTVDGHSYLYVSIPVQLILYNAYNRVSRQNTTVSSNLLRHVQRGGEITLPTRQVHFQTNISFHTPFMVARITQPVLGWSEICSESGRPLLDFKDTPGKICFPLRTDFHDSIDVSFSAWLEFETP